MRVMVLIKANQDTEAGVMPGEQLLTEMGQFNETLVKAGVMLAGEGLHCSARGKRVIFSGCERTVVDGPFTESKELIAGFWLWQVKSMEEAVEWVKRCPNPTGDDGQIELRPVHEMDDFSELTPELREQEARVRARTEQMMRYALIEPRRRTMEYMLLIIEPTGQRRERTEEEGRDLYARACSVSVKTSGRAACCCRRSRCSPTRVACACESATAGGL